MIIIDGFSLNSNLVWDRILDKSVYNVRSEIISKLKLYFFSNVTRPIQKQILEEIYRGNL